MRELSLHILDIVQNSIAADACLIRIEIVEDIKSDRFELCIEDNGKGMDHDMVRAVMDPFTTTRETRNVGLGIPLLKAAAERCDGSLVITSEKSKGTLLRARFVRSHIDRAPLGDMVQTMLSLIVCNPSIDFLYTHTVGKQCFNLDTREIRKVIDGVPINQSEIILWITEYLKEGISNLYGGAVI